MAINKLERKGGLDALRDVRKQVQRNREAFDQSPDKMPVFGTIAARFNDDGVTALYQALADGLRGLGLHLDAGALPKVDVMASTRQSTIIPSSAQRYLAEIAEEVRGYHADTEKQATIARQIQHLRSTADLLSEYQESDGAASDGAASDGAASDSSAIESLLSARQDALSTDNEKLLAEWPKLVEAFSKDEWVSSVRGKEIRTATQIETLSGTRISKVSLPKYSDHGDLLSWIRRENLPGRFPYTAGVFPFKRSGEDPTRMFAGEGGPLRTNKPVSYTHLTLPTNREV